ncbi:hypothetical protein JOQ06_024574 [Pogonophryne albipinna]|uniref:Uncharacterized protein n=1 Tax=Pogonophryne albipinna TaxID=1090488 RepID=A0AAD6F4Q1_9TELE|nr:hypothetical protein JOQ06_026297 [Pogonophryne albipinna]KAJ4920743.1 hypothetical protein JOQ06_024574 [Pogonophryne albipinna]
MKRAGGSEQEEEEEMKRAGGRGGDEESRRVRAGGRGGDEETRRVRAGGRGGDEETRRVKQEEEEEMKRAGGSEQEEEEEMKRAGGRGGDEESRRVRAGGRGGDEESRRVRAGGRGGDEESRRVREEEEEEEMKRAGGSEQEEEEEMKRAGGSEQEEEEEMKRAGGLCQAAGGDGLCSGRLEVNSDPSDPSWSSVCEADFDQQDAQVVCRQLGCGAPSVLQGALYGEGEAPMGTKEFQCGGHESALLDCSSASEKNTCSPGTAVSLTCSEPGVQLVGGESRCAGDLELEHLGEGDQWQQESSAESSTVALLFLWEREVLIQICVEDQLYLCSVWICSVGVCRSDSSDYFLNLTCSGMASCEMPSLRHGVRVIPQENSTVESVLLAVGEQVGHGNISYASRMNKAVVVFVKKQDAFYRITISGVPPFIPNETLEKELKRYGRIASGFRTVSLGCKDTKLKHVQSLRRQVFMFLDCTSQTLDVSFRIKCEEGFYMVYASAGSVKCFGCGDVGHKKIACPQRLIAALILEGNIVNESGEGTSGVARPVRGAAGATGATALFPGLTYSCLQPPGPPCPRSVLPCARLQCRGPRCPLLLHPCPLPLYPHPVQPCSGPSCPHSLCPV